MGAKPLWEQMLEKSGRRRRMENIGVPGRQGFSAPSGGLVPQPSLDTPSENDVRFDPDQLLALIRAAYRQGNILMMPFSVGVDPIQLRPAVTNRRYLFLQNQSAANNIALGIGQQPGPVAGVPSAGLIIQANFGFYEPLLVPQGEIWVVAAGANTAGILLYSE